MDELLFTPASILSLLSKIDELQDVDIGLAETIDGELQLTVGDSVYLISSEEAVNIEVDESTVASISDTNLDAYEELVESDNLEVVEDEVTGSIIKKLAKLLLVGGLVRLTSNLLKN